ncbi:hypothetical protein DYB36_014393 [Aphanomyces astaci]|uniref:Uncharacterized protein n=1 Tax=Aphanomyces astaci TaxID=112090 RepID=A0A396ZTA2_APHAT|nr:hypothetical protein DYB36_014393 [Aphanomyces astaci]
MLDLTCVVVGDGHKFSAQIDADETGHDVKIAFMKFIHGAEPMPWSCTVRCMAEMSRLRGILSLFSAVENKLTVENKLKTPLSLDISAVHLLFCCDPKKNVCIVEAKSTDLWQGMAQALLGCEVQAEVCNLHEVFGIVTNYTRWWFLRSLDDKTEKETCSLVIEGNVPTSASQ